ncbi:MAG: transglutaminase-like domain-containing protein [Pseudomonadota bacterium]
MLLSVICIAAVAVAALRIDDSGVARDEEIVADLLDQTNAAFVVSAEELMDPIVLSSAEIDTTIDRRAILSTLFERLTANAATDTEKVEIWVRYLQDRVAHPRTCPLLENGQAIYDPLWILENRLGQCGQTNRVVVDGLLAAEFEARVVQLNRHVAAEVWLDGQWRYLDANWLNLGQFVRKADGSWPSAAEIHANPALVANMRPGTEYALYAADVLGGAQGSYARAFEEEPYYYVKTATSEEEKNIYYGWNYYDTVTQ